MNSPQLSYFQDEGILYLSLSDEPKVGSVEISPDITAELNENGDITLAISNETRLGREQKSSKYRRTWNFLRGCQPDFRRSDT
nr:MAG: Protein of unknown function (DUF2283) [Candidatus Kentron sp. LPFa]